MGGVSELLASANGPLTVDDLLALPERPDDGWRYELVDGSLMISAGPRPLHQLAVTRLLTALQAAIEPPLLPIAGGAGVLLDPTTLLIPDLLVLRSDADLSGPSFRREDVVLVVEVVSPSNAATDLVLKRAVYARHAIQHYWIMDVRSEPRLTLLELDGEAYMVRQEVDPEGALRLPDPLGVPGARLELRPADLLSR